MLELGIGTARCLSYVPLPLPTFAHAQLRRTGSSCFHLSQGWRDAPTREEGQVVSSTVKANNDDFKRSAVTGVASALKTSGNIPTESYLRSNRITNIRPAMSKYAVDKLCLLRPPVFKNRRTWACASTPNRCLMRHSFPALKKRKPH